MPPVHPPPQPQAAVNPGPGSLSEEQKKSIWFLKPEDKTNYMKIFKMFDKNNTNTLSDTEMQQVMQ